MLQALGLISLAIRWSPYDVGYHGNYRNNPDHSVLEPMITGSLGYTTRPTR